MKKLPIFIGILQALGIAIYCSLVAGLLNFAEGYFGKEANPYFSITLMLILLVFSAGITGGLFFGYPVYLAIKGNIRSSLIVLAATAITLVGVILVVFVLGQVYM